MVESKGDVPKEPPKEAAAPEIGQMKRGDYLIHVFIEQARQLKCPEGNTVDPIIECQVMNERKFTTAKDDIGGGTALCTWNEHLFFEPRNVTKEEIEQAKIQVRVLDKGYFKDAIIGAYDFDIAFIYFMKQHSLLHRWIALSNPESPAFNEVTGYLKLSIQVTTKGDETIQINEDTGGPDKNDQGILMPPQIRPEYYQVKIRFFRAEKLPMMDNNLLGQAVGLDAYMVCQYLAHKLQTEVITVKEGQKIDWNTEFLIPVQLPVMSGRVVMKLFDKDPITDEIIGSILFNLKDCMKEENNGKFFWRNVYGAPLDRHGPTTDLMNANPEVASAWKGRLLVQVTSEKTDKPTCVKRKIDPKELVQAEPYLQNREFEIIAEVCQGIALPGEEKYNVWIQVADQIFKTEKPVFCEKNYNRWSCRFKQTTFRAPYVSLENIGRVFVYLMQGDNAICYYKAKIEEFMDPNAQIKWVELTNDLAVGKISESHKAGLISFKLSIHDRTANGPISFDQYDAWKKPPPKRMKVYKARVYIYQCRDLPSADDDGQSDPYIKVWDQLGTCKTQCIEDNNNPIFFETLEIPVIETETIKDLPPFVLDVYDRDPLSTDDFIGRSIIPLSEAKYTLEEEVLEPQWHKCRMKPGAPAQGEILVSFAIYEQDYTFRKIAIARQMRLQDTVSTKEFQVDINILGLRDLQSVGILPVKKAFIIFNLKSLVSPDDGRALENVRTQPGPTGANPTINSLISFKLPLPTSPLFCPKLVCTVYDYIFMGMNQPLIGSFTIPIGDLIYNLKREREEETKAIQNILDDLDKIMRDEGITTYNIQTVGDRTSESPIPSRPLGEFVMKQVSQAKKNMNVDEEQKQPLLYSIQEEETQMMAGSMERRKVSFDPLRTASQNQYDPARTTSQKQFDTARTASTNPDGRTLSAKALPYVARSSIDDFDNTMKARLRNPTRITSRMSKEEVGDGSKKRTNTMKQFEKVDKFGSGMKAQLLTQIKEENEKWQRDAEDLRIRELQEFKASGGKKAIKNVIMPEYALDERLKVHREVNVPPESMYLGLGWDENPETKKKHYRRFYVQELEKIKEVMPVESPFASFDIMRGQSRGASKSWWPFAAKPKEDDSGEVTNEHSVGKFKGIVTVQSEDDLAAYKDQKNELVHNLKAKLNQLSLKKRAKPIDMRLEKLASSEGRGKFDVDLEELGVAHLEITKHLADLYSDELLSRMLMTQMKCLIRVYIISAYNLSSRDNGSESDPYLIINCGNREYNEKDKYVENEPNPEFYKCYEFEGQFPGCAPLVLKIMDYDDIFGDDVIGTTTVDLEDRYFSPEWQSLKHKPIEYRMLSHPSSSISQGTVKMWLNIIPTSIPLNTVPHYDINPKPSEDFEIRLCIFNTLEVKCMDIEGTSDVFCRAFFDSATDAKETDTHFRCSNGKASFNYRLLFNLKHPRKDYTLTLQLYDRDFFKSNDIIGDAIIDLTKAIEDSSLTKRPLGLTKSYFNNYLKESGANLDYKDDNTFWVPIRSMNNDTGKLEQQGKVRIQIDILPRDHAEKNKVGEARQDPNHSPFLPPPVGRLSLSLNPFKMLSQLVGPAMLRKIYCFTCLACVCALCIALAPLIFSNVISALITKAIGI